MELFAEGKYVNEHAAILHNYKTQFSNSVRPFLASYNKEKHFLTGWSFLLAQKEYFILQPNFVCTWSIAKIRLTMRMKERKWVVDKTTVLILCLFLLLQKCFYPWTEQTSPIKYCLFLLHRPKCSTFFKFAPFYSSVLLHSHPILTSSQNSYSRNGL